MLRYRILASGKGVLLTRTPHRPGSKVHLRIEGWQEGDRLVLTRTDDRAIYRTLCEGSCHVPSELLYGTVTVTLLRKGGTVVPCESLFCEDIDGVRLLMPADMDLPGRVVQLEVQTEALPAWNRQMKEQAQELQKLRNVLAEVVKWIRTQEEKGELPI